MKRSIHVCKVPGGWLIEHRTLSQAFWWDLCHYGLGIAAHNMLWVWVHRHDRWVRSG